MTDGKQKFEFIATHSGYDLIIQGRNKSIYSKTAQECLENQSIDKR